MVSYGILIVAIIVSLLLGGSVGLFVSALLVATDDDEESEGDDRGDKNDQLIADGWIRPPCKVGDDVYWIDTETNEIKCEKNDIKAICYYGEGKFKVIVSDENTPEDIGTKWCMLTKEEAEEKLKELKDNDGTTSN